MNKQILIKIHSKTKKDLKLIINYLYKKEGIKYTYNEIIIKLLKGGLKE